MQVILIVVVMGAATLSAVSGVDKGIRRMSELNMLLALLMFFSCCSPGRPAIC